MLYALKQIARLFIAGILLISSCKKTDVAQPETPIDPATEASRLPYPQAMAL